MNVIFWFISAELVDRHGWWWGLGTWEKCLERKFQGVTDRSLAARKDPAYARNKKSHDL